jgi:phosphatidylserine synthase 2
MAGYSAVHGPEAALIRPHPALWRLWHGVSVAYMLFLAFLLFQTPAGARSFMKV